MTYKQDIDDTREAPGMKIAQKLIEKFGNDRVLCCDPNLDSIKNLKNLELGEAILNSDILIFCVPHKEFKNLDIEDLSDKIIIDVCGVFEE